MQVEALVELIEGGNFQTVEDEWLAALDDEAATPQRFATFVPIIDALAKAGRTEQVETLILTAIEVLVDRFGAADTLVAARAWLLALNKSVSLRDEVLRLYRSAYADRPGIEALIERSGLAGSRPPRRAMRTLDVCLSLAPSSYLVGHGEEGPARVESVDAETWHVEIQTPDKKTVVGPVQLADAYEPAASTDYRVLWHFDPERLTALLDEDPIPVLTSIVRSHGDRLNGDILEDLLSPRFISSDRWSKWWTRARTLIKRTPHLRVEGRSPYIVVFDAEAQTLEEETLERFKHARDPVARLGLLEEYLRESRVRKSAPDDGLLRTFAESLEKAADRQQANRNLVALTSLLVAGRAREARSEGSCYERVDALLADADDPLAHIAAIEQPGLWIRACECLERARPDDATAIFSRLLPVSPTSVCDHLAERMLDRGYPVEGFDAFVQDVLKEPVRHFRALCWLWVGPSRADVAQSVTPLALLNRMLGTLTSMRRDDTLDKETVRSIRAEARAALSARKCERFAACIETVDLGMAAAFRSQVSRLENLSRPLRADLLRIIERRFPDLLVRREVERWADDAVLYVTERGMAVKQAEIHELVNVKMRENAIAIGRAAERGDLSENSEYKFALEERDLLRARLAQMNTEMEIAQVFSADDVPDDRVGIGTRVVLRHAETGETRELTILGPWEANIERRIINYKAPMAGALLGAQPGATVELALGDSAGQYVVDSIANAMLGG